MDSSQPSWRTEWPLFIKHVTALYDQGETDAAVTKNLIDTKLSWTGQVAEMALDDAYIPGARMDMEPIEATLSDGRRTTVKHLFLLIAPDDIEHWRHISVGDRVRFELNIAERNGPFPGVQWTDLDSQRGILLIGSENGRLIERIYGS